MQNRKPIIQPHRTLGIRYAPETMPMIYCAACLVQVLENSDEARHIYEDIVKSYDLPEMLEMFKALAQRVPDGTNLVKEFIGTNEGQKPLEHAQTFIKNTYNQVVGDALWFKKWGDLENDEIYSKDFKHWIGLAKELVRAGFNHKDNIKKGSYKVVIKESNPLVETIFYRSFADFRGVELAVDENGIIALSDGKKMYDLRAYFDLKIGSRKQRRMANHMKQFGYRLTHDKKINRIAENWYNCRILHTNVEQYADAESYKGNILDVKNIEKEVKLCDDALGYKRR